MSKVLPSLLLLPPAPSPCNPTTLSAAYRPTITDTVSALKGLSTSTELLVVLPCPTSHAQLQAPRSQIYSPVQQLLGGLYSLICAICAKLEVDIEADAPGSIDMRILLLDHQAAESILSDQDQPAFDPLVTGPIIDLPTLALTRRRWNLIFSVDGEQGQKLLASYTSLANCRSPPLTGHVRTVRGGHDSDRAKTNPTASRLVGSPSCRCSRRHF